MSDPDTTPSRHDGWSPSRQREFLEHLAVSGLVRTACAAIGISREAAYRLRQRREGAAFALGWDAALLLARWALADTLMERAVDGQTEVVERDPDSQRRIRHRHDNRLALSLLGRLDRFAGADEGGSGDARLVAGDWDAYLDMIGAGHEGSGAALFLTARRAAEKGDTDPHGPCQLCGSVEVSDDDEAAHDDPAPATRTSFVEADDEWGDELDEAGMRDYLSIFRYHGQWVTNFPPPPAYRGSEKGAFGDPAYYRSLTGDELASVEAPRLARVTRELAIARDLYAEAFPPAGEGSAT